MLRKEVYLANVFSHFISKKPLVIQKLFLMILNNIHDMDKELLKDEEKTRLESVSEKSNIDFITGLVSWFSKKEFRKALIRRSSVWYDLEPEFFENPERFIKEFTFYVPYSDRLPVEFIKSSYISDDTVYLKLFDRDKHISLWNWTLKKSIYSKVATDFKMYCRTRNILLFYQTIEEEVAGQVKFNKESVDSTFEITLSVWKLKWLMDFFSIKDKADPDTFDAVSRKFLNAVTDDDYRLIIERHEDVFNPNTIRFNVFKDLLIKMTDEINESEFSGLHIEVYGETRHGRKMEKVSFLVNEYNDDQLFKSSFTIKDAVRENGISDVRCVILEVIPSVDRLFTDDACLKIATDTGFDTKKIKSGFLYLKEKAEKETVPNAVGVVIEGSREYVEPISIGPEDLK